MKKVLSGCAVLVLGAAPALATDLPAKAPAYKAPATFSFSGVYGGISGGYGWGENNISDAVPPFAIKLKPSGWFGGAQIGYNDQFAPHWLLGGEVDFSFGDVSDSSTPFVGGEARNKFDTFGTARTRFGYVQDRTLIYGTFGAIWLHEKYVTTAALGTVSLTDLTQYHVGWVFGGGIEYAIDSRWSWKLEYLYAPFDSSRDNTAGIVRTTDANFSVVRAGLNYRFGGEETSASSIPVKAAVSKSSWSGGYLGVHGGYGWSKLEENTSVLGAASPKPDGGYIGYGGGYNWLFAPNALVGIEVDSSFGDLKGSSPFFIPLQLDAKIEDLGTARFRLGYFAAPNALLYATGGAAYAREKTVTPASTSFDTKADHLGWTLGGGVEWMFAPEWSLKAEYLYADLGNLKVNSGVAPTRTSDLTLNTVRVGVNYYGPLIERFFGK